MFKIIYSKLSFRLRDNSRPHPYTHSSASIVEKRGGRKTVRGYVDVMSTLGVGRGIPTKQTRVLISCVSVTVTKGEKKRVRKSENFAYVICTCPLRRRMCAIKGAVPWLQDARLVFAISSLHFSGDLREADVGGDIVAKSPSIEATRNFCLYGTTFGFQTILSPCLF